MRTRTWRLAPPAWTKSQVAGPLTRSSFALRSVRWRGDESEEIFFTVPEMSRPVIAVEHVSVRVSPQGSTA